MELSGFITHQLAASVEVVHRAGSGRVEADHAAPGVSVDRVAIAPVPDEASRSVEDGQGAVGVVVDPDVCLDVVETTRAGGELQSAR